MQESKQKQQFKVEQAGNFELHIGSGNSCGIKVPSLPELSATLKRRGDRMYIKNQNNDSWININNERNSHRRWIEITRYDEISVCEIPLVLDSRVFLGQSRINIDTTKLFAEIPGKGIVCDGTYIRAKHGTLTTIMGPSGSGKTILLQLINGNKSPSQGTVSINERFDLHRDLGLLTGFIGYVPQDEVMIPELTVHQSLDYRLRIRYPDMVPSVRNRLIEETCKKLGFHGENLSIFLNTIIGSVESGHRGLSGGEKKRANIAHELVLKPLLLILDEPTSGLSSIGADQIVQLLHQLAREDGLTIIAAIHQPSRDAFELFDNLLIYTPGGKPAYHGKASNTIEYFEHIGNGSPQGKNPAEFIEQTLTEPSTLENAITQFDEYSQSKPEEFENEASPANLIYKPYYSEKDTLQKRKEIKKRGERGLSLIQFIRQWQILFQRNLHVLLKDKIGLLLLFGQVPLIALLVVFTFKGFVKDNQKIDEVSNILYHFGVIKDDLQKRKIPVNIDKTLHKAINNSHDTPELLSELGAKQRGSIYFVLVASSIWFGIMGGCKEIVFEKHILLRELRSGVYPSPYLLAKLSMLSLTGGIQTAGLSLLTLPFLLSLSLVTLIYIWLVFWLVSVASASLGLFVSCISKSYRSALSSVPLIVIPQLLLGGLLRPFVDWGSDSWVNIMSTLTIQRWGFAASLNADPYALGNILKLNLHYDALKDRGGELNVIKIEQASILDVFFPLSSNIVNNTYLLILLGFIAIFFLFGVFSLMRMK